MIALTRRYHFSASHRLHSPALSDTENARVFGKCNNPFGHGHNYVLEVTVAGEPDPASGLIMPLPALDRFVTDKILRLFAHRNLNLDVRQFARLIPTTENLALVIGDLLEEYWPDQFPHSPARLLRVHIQETDRNGFEVPLGQRRRASAPHLENESAIVHV
jgi:6-pyruvoyltetrahydropterin/6-carboxytetrahydropterin synthase